MTEYRGYHIYYDPPPIPIRKFDYCFVHRDFDGPGDPRHGAAETITEALREIDTLEDGDTP